MADEQKPAGDNPEQKPAIPAHLCTLVIVWDKKVGSVQVSGNALGDKIVSYGLLECAKDAIEDMQRKAMAQAQKNPGMLDFARSLKH